MREAGNLAPRALTQLPSRENWFVGQRDGRGMPISLYSRTMYALIMRVAGEAAAKRYLDRVCRSNGYHSYAPVGQISKLEHIRKTDPAVRRAEFQATVALFTFVALLSEIVGGPTNKFILAESVVLAGIDARDIFMRTVWFLILHQTGVKTRKLSKTFENLRRPLGVYSVEQGSNRPCSTGWRSE